MTHGVISVNEIFMPVQSHGGGWRARKKHAGQWFMGPVRESVQLAEEDARKFDEASAVSLEALQEVQRNLDWSGSAALLGKACAWLIFRHDLTADEAVHSLLVARPSLYPWKFRPHALWALKTWEKTQANVIRPRIAIAIEEVSVQKRKHKRRR